MTAPVVDPFGTPPADEAQQAPPVAPNPTEEPFAAPPAEAPAAPAAPAKAPAKKAAPKAAVVGSAAVSDGKVVLTFKGGTGFDAPWIVIHATSLDDALDQVSGENGATLVKLMEYTQNAGQHFAKLGGGSGGQGGQRPARQSAPPAALQPPAGAPPSPGEGWVYKTGTTKSGPKAGQTWQGWMPPRGSSEAPVFF